MNGWTPQQKLEYLTGQLSMADEMLADLRRNNSHAGVINAQIQEVEALRADVIKQIEALDGDGLCEMCGGTGTVIAYADGFPLACWKCRGTGKA